MLLFGKKIYIKTHFRDTLLRILAKRSNST